MITLEPLTKEDYATAATIFAECRDFLVYISGEKPDSTAIELVAREAAAAAAHRAVFAGIRPAGSRSMIGVATYQPSGYGGDPAAAWIALLLIAPPYRGKGYGARACRLIEHSVFVRGATSIRLGVLLNNPAAVLFWKTMGYRDIGIVKPHGSGHVVAVL